MDLSVSHVVKSFDSAFCRRERAEKVNQSVEAFLYCILGAQVNVGSSILVMEAGQKKRRARFSHCWRTLSGRQLAKGVQRCQLAVDKAKVRLYLAATPGSWLMPSHIAINTERTVAYNNKLRQVTPNMNLWLNNDVNKDTKKVGLRLMAEFLPKLTRQTITHLIPFTRRQ